MGAYYRRLTGDNEEEKVKCALAWSKWEMATSRLIVDASLLAKGDDPKFAVAFSRIESHYFVNGAFFKSEEHLLDNVDKIRHIPAVIVQGRYDVVCPMKSAWDLHKAWPESELKIIPDAGHSMKEPGIVSELVIATDKYSSL
jgi:proline iminopeptidase